MALETFNALRDRQTSGSAPGEMTLRGRVNLLNWDGTGAPSGLFPEKALIPEKALPPERSGP
ncbi:nitrate reductase, partial [Arthrobacter sp. Hiyo6]